MPNTDLIASKILSDNALDTALSCWRGEHKRIVFSNGCFDIMHMGHVDYLAKAADQGDILIVALNTDASVKRLKGSGRPVNNQQARAWLMAALFFVDAVVFFDEDTPYQLIQKVQPDILVKGSDYKPEDIVGYDIVKAKGGEVITLDFLPGFSTTTLLNKLKE